MPSLNQMKASDLPLLVSIGHGMAFILETDDTEAQASCTTFTRELQALKALAATSAQRSAHRIIALRTG